MKQRLASALAVAALSYAAAASGYSRTGGVWRTLPVSWFWNPATVPASLGGMDNGRLAFEALLARDYPVLMGVFFATSVMVVAFNLLTDLLYAVIDPRVEVEG